MSRAEGKPGRARRVVVALTMLAGALQLLGLAVPRAAALCWFLALAVLVSAGVLAGLNSDDRRRRARITR